MRRASICSWAIAWIAACLVLSSAAAEDDTARRGLAVSAGELYQTLVDTEDRKERVALAMQLAEAPGGLRMLLRGTESDDADVRFDCYAALFKHFPCDARVLSRAARSGLRSEGRVQWLCIFHLAEHRVYAAQGALRQLTTIEHSEQVRMAAARALARLGEADAIRVLYFGLGSDSATVRLWANEGVKELSGRCPEDFDYAAIENAFISSVEFVPSFRAADQAEWTAKRWTAIAEFSRWLRDEKPALCAKLERNNFALLGSGDLR